MDARIWEGPKRSEEEWAPFMAGLFQRIRRERRRRALRHAAAAACVAASLVIGLMVVQTERPEVIFAEVPTTDAPVFEPAAGTGPDGGSFVMVSLNPQEAGGLP